MTDFIRIEFNGTETTLGRDELIEVLAEDRREDLEGAIDGQVEDYEADIEAMDHEELAKEYEDRTGGQIRIQRVDEEA